MNISVVIPTCNRKKNVLSLLHNLNNSIHPIEEVIIVDSGNDRLNKSDCHSFVRLNILIIHSISSVCIQRNIGINAAKSEWIFLCDDDIEVPEDYLQKINEHLQTHAEAKAISGLVLQKENDNWQAFYPIHSTKELLLKYIFGLSIWGEIKCVSKNYFIKKIKKIYKKRGNFIAKSGFPVITNICENHFIVPAYGLGASIIQKHWLQLSPYDRMLDKYGIGDNYGVAMGFPKNEIHVLNEAFVYHHQEEKNRLNTPLQYYRRALALEYFIQIKRCLPHVKKYYLLWALLGNWLIYFSAQNKLMAATARKTFFQILYKRNPYTEAASKGQKIVEAELKTK